MVLGFVFLGIVALVLVWTLTRWVGSYRDRIGTTWQRAVSASMGSATMLWSYILGWIGALLSFLDLAATLLGSSEMRSIVHLLPPRWVGPILLLIAVINITARLRTLLKDRLP